MAAMATLAAAAAAEISRHADGPDKDARILPVPFTPSSACLPFLSCFRQAAVATVAGDGARPEVVRELRLDACQCHHRTRLLQHCCLWHLELQQQTCGRQVPIKRVARPQPGGLGPRASCVANVGGETPCKRHERRRVSCRRLRCRRGPGHGRRALRPEEVHPGISRWHLAAACRAEAQHGDLAGPQPFAFARDRPETSSQGAC